MFARFLVLAGARRAASAASASTGRTIVIREMVEDMAAPATRFGGEVVR